MKYILFSDIDDTVFGRNGYNDPDNIPALRDFIAAGHRLVFCTGRNDHEFNAIADRLPVDYEGLILNNGARIQDRTRKDLYHKVIEGDAGRSVLDVLLRYPDHYVCCYAPEFGEPIGIRNHETCRFEKGRFIKEYDRNFYDIMKRADAFDILCLHCETKEPARSLEQLLLEHYADAVMPHVNTHWLDIVPPGCTKGTGIRKYLRLTGFRDGLSEGEDSSARYVSISIGDSFNDIPMFEATDLSFTFPTAPADVRSAAGGTVPSLSDLIRSLSGTE